MEKMNGILTSRTQLLRSNQQDQKEVSLSPDWGGEISQRKEVMCASVGLCFPICMGRNDSKERERGVAMQ